MAKRGPWVLGVSNSHNGAVCLLEGDRIVAAVQEERLSRRKRQRIYGAKPSLALTYCLEQAGIQASDLDLVVYCSQARATTPDEDMHLNPVLQTQHHGIPVVRISHHLAHAVSAFATSPPRRTAGRRSGRPTTGFSSSRAGTRSGACSTTRSAGRTPERRSPRPWTPPPASG